MMDLAAVGGVAKRLMLKHKETPPTLVIETSDTVEIKVLDYLPSTTFEKKKLLFTLGHDMAMEHDIEARDVEQLIWICEAWFTQKHSQEEMDRAPSPSKDPNRQEGLIVLSLTIKGRQLAQSLHLIEVIRHGNTLDLLPRNEPMDEVESGLLTSCLAGIVAASLADSELDAIIKKAME